MGGNEEERGRQIENEELRMMNEKLGTEYSTEGLGDLSKTEEKTVVSITEINFRLYQK